MHTHIHTTHTHTTHIHAHPRATHICTHTCTLTCKTHTQTHRHTHTQQQQKQQPQQQQERSIVCPIDFTGKCTRCSLSCYVNETYPNQNICHISIDQVSIQFLLIVLLYHHIISSLKVYTPSHWRPSLFRVYPSPHMHE